MLETLEFTAQQQTAYELYLEQQKLLTEIGVHREGFIYFYHQYCRDLNYSLDISEQQNKELFRLADISDKEQKESLRKKAKEKEREKINNFLSIKDISLYVDYKMFLATTQEKRKDMTFIEYGELYLAKKAKHDQEILNRYINTHTINYKTM